MHFCYSNLGGLAEDTVLQQIEGDCSLLSECCAISPSKSSQPSPGYTPDAVRSKIKRGDWLEGEVWIKAPDVRILIDCEGYEKWATKSGIRARSESSIEIDFYYRGVRCRERVKLQPNNKT